MSRGSHSREALWRPLGFFVLMVGLGFRLDTEWQGLAWVPILTGVVTGGLALLPLASRRSSTAFVPPEGRR